MLNSFFWYDSSILCLKDTRKLYIQEFLSHKVNKFVRYLPKLYGNQPQDIRNKHRNLISKHLRSFTLTLEYQLNNSLPELTEKFFVFYSNTESMIFINIFYDYASIAKMHQYL